MKNFLKSYTLLLSMALFLLGFLSFWAIEKVSCFEISIKEQIKIKAGFCYLNI